MLFIPRLNRSLDCPSCTAKRRGLVHYPTTLAPVNGSKTVTAQCADNAHIRSGSSLSVRCTFSGDWTGPTPQCECDAGYHAASVTGRQECQGIGAIVNCLDF